MVLVVRPEELRGLVSMAEAVAAVEAGFRAWGENRALNAPRRRVHTPSGVRVSVHQGAVPTLGSGPGREIGASGLHVHCEVFRPGAPVALRTPVHVLYDAADGQLLAVLIGDLTAAELPDATAMSGLRTAATSVVGTQRLARADGTRLGLFGAAGQARVHLAALAAVRPLERVHVYRRDAAARRAFCEEMERHVAAELRPVDTPAEAVRDMDLVLTATNADEPVFDGRLLQPGQHVTSIVGTNNAPGGRLRRELDDAAVQRMDRIGVASREEIIPDRQGDLYEPLQAGLIRLEDVVDLGELTTGQAPGRADPAQVTLFKNNAGQGVADVALAALFHARARERGLGEEVG